MFAVEKDCELKRCNLLYSPIENLTSSTSKKCHCAFNIEALRAAEK